MRNIEWDFICFVQYLQISRLLMVLMTGTMRGPELVNKLVAYLFADLCLLTPISANKRAQKIPPCGGIFLRGELLWKSYEKACSTGPAGQVLNDFAELLVQQNFLFCVLRSFVLCLKNNVQVCWKKDASVAKMWSSVSILWNSSVERLAELLHRIGFTGTGEQMRDE